MNILFIEYKVAENKEETYTHKMFNKLKKHENVEWMESHEQIRLYLEIWRFASVKELHEFSQERTEKADSSWRVFDDLIVGGIEKLNAWSFRVRSES